MPLVVVEEDAGDGEQAVVQLALDVELEEQVAVVEAEHEELLRIAGMREHAGRAARAKLHGELLVVPGGAGARRHLERVAVLARERQLQLARRRFHYSTHTFRRHKTELSVKSNQIKIWLQNELTTKKSTFSLILTNNKPMCKIE